MLVGRNISKSMGGRKILSDVSISLEKGEIVALVGPSGGGKSTLLRNLSLLEKPDSGSICLDNITFNFPSKEKFVPSLIHPAISLVFQQFHLWPHLKIRDNLLMPIKVANTLSTWDLHFRCISLISTLESLLLKDEERAKSALVKQRLVCLVANNESEGRKVNEVFGHIYDVRHDMVHKAKRIDIDMQKLSEVQFIMVHLLRRLVHININEKVLTKNDFINGIAV